MAYLEELLPEFRKGAKIRLNSWPEDKYIYQFEEENPKDFTVHSERMSELLNLINSIVKGD